MRRASLLLATLAALVAAGCGSSDDKKDTTSTAAEPAQSQPADTSSTPAEATGGTASVKPTPTKDLSKKPAIPRQAGDPPTTLVKQDIVTGKGATAEAGDTVTVRYVGVRFRDNQQFDASWERSPNSFDFPLGGGQVIQGWDKGVVGMKVGGRRQLTIPPDLGYGAQGTPDGSILPNETLIFVVDLKKVQKR